MIHHHSSQCARVGIGNAKQCRTKQYIVLWNNRSGWHFVNNPLSLTSIEEKNRGGPRNPATTKMEFYVARLLDLLFKRNKKIWQTHLPLKKLHSPLGHLKTFNLKTSRTLKSSWKQEIEQVQMQAPTSRCCAAELLKFSVISRLDQHRLVQMRLFWNYFGDNTLAGIGCKESHSWIALLTTFRSLIDQGCGIVGVVRKNIKN